MLFFRALLVQEKQTCKQRVRTRYIRLPDLLEENNEATLTRKAHARLLKRYSSNGLLILAEWLLGVVSEDEQYFLFELIERRHDAAPTVFCTQYRQEDWHTRLGSGVHTDAIMARSPSREIIMLYPYLKKYLRKHLKNPYKSKDLIIIIFEIRVKIINRLL